MAEDALSQNELELANGDKKLRIRGSDWLGLMNAIALGVALYGGYDHLQAAKEGDRKVAESIEKQANAQVQLVRAMQEANCLARLTPEQKKKFDEIDFCRKVGQGKAF